MSSIVSTHRAVIKTGPRGETLRTRSTIHITRTDILATYAEACRATARQLPSKNMTVYEGEDCVILERDV